MSTSALKSELARMQALGDKWFRVSGAARLASQPGQLSFLEYCRLARIPAAAAATHPPGVALPPSRAAASTVASSSSSSSTSSSSSSSMKTLDALFKKKRRVDADSMDAHAVAMRQIDADVNSGRTDCKSLDAQLCGALVKESQVEVSVGDER
jgi:hypothetical protein